jgi:hypothetical protein
MNDDDDVDSEDELSDMLDSEDDDDDIIDETEESKVLYYCLRNSLI